MVLGAFLHRVTSPIVLGVVFSVLFTPPALPMKASKRDTMTRRIDSDATSYWIPRTPPRPPPASLRNQF